MTTKKTRTTRTSTAKKAPKKAMRSISASEIDLLLSKPPTATGVKKAEEYVVDALRSHLHIAKNERRFYAYLLSTRGPECADKAMADHHECLAVFYRLFATVPKLRDVLAEEEGSNLGAASRSASSAAAE